MAADALTLSEVMVPARGISRDVALVGSFAGLTALAAQVTIYLPFTPCQSLVRLLRYCYAGLCWEDDAGLLPSYSILAWEASACRSLPAEAVGCRLARVGDILWVSWWLPT